MACLQEGSPQLERNQEEELPNGAMDAMNAWKMTSMGLVGAAAIAVALFAGVSAAVVETSPEFEQACKRAGARFLRPPANPVTAVALDYSPPYAANRPYRRFEFDSGDRIARVGSLMWQPRIEEHLDRFEVRAQFGYDDPRRRFQRYERSLRWNPVSELSGQVVVTDTVVHPEELIKPLRQEGLIIHHLKAVDLRDGHELAEMDFVVDMANGRGCGSNIERDRDVQRAIDVDQFILQAVGVPVVVPQWELERRRHAFVH